MSASRQRGILRFGDFEADLSAGELRKHGTRIRLELQPFQVLAMLLERRGGVVTREELKQALWTDDTFVDFDNSVNTAIRKIRRALSDSAAQPRFVETLPRRGYRFIFDAEPPASSFDSIAVLPLDNLSGDPDQEYFSDGLTDALITYLAKISALKVISRTSVMQYKGARRPLREIARELGVDVVVEGSVHREGSLVRVTAQLIEAATDCHLWAESYEREITSALALQSQVAREVAQRIKVRLTPSESSHLSRAGTVNTEAFEAYLRGRFQLHRFTPEGIQTALTYFHAAREADPGSGPAASGLAEAWFFGTLLALVPPAEAGPRGLAAAAAAVELDPALAEGHVMLGLFRQYYERDWPGAESAFRKALDLSPSNADAHIYYALLLTCLGRTGEAAQQMQSGLELDPLNLMFQHVFGVQLTWLGKFDQAIIQLQGVVSRAPNMQMAHLTLWACLNAVGRHEEALRAAIAAWSVVNDQDMVRAFEQGAERLSRSHAAGSGDTVARSQSAYVLPHVVSLLFDAAGDAGQALEWIERGYEQREHAISYFHRKPYSSRVKQDSRFEEMLQRLGLPR